MGQAEQVRRSEGRQEDREASGGHSGLWVELLDGERWKGGPMVEASVGGEKQSPSGNIPRYK